MCQTITNSCPRKSLDHFLISRLSFTSAAISLANESKQGSHLACRERKDRWCLLQHHHLNHQLLHCFAILRTGKEVLHCEGSPLLAILRTGKEVLHCEGVRNRHLKICSTWTEPFNSHQVHTNHHVHIHNKPYHAVADPYHGSSFTSIPLNHLVKQSANKIVSRWSAKSIGKNCPKLSKP